MTTAHVVLHAGFDPGARIMLVKVPSERTLRAEGGEAIDSRAADDRGTVTFDAGVELGARYIAVGVRDRHPIEVRARGEESEHAAPQQPLRPDRPHELRRPID
jgi:hypothetical protein